MPMTASAGHVCPSHIIQNMSSIWNLKHGRASAVDGSETTDELDPLKGLTRLLTLVEMKRKGGENL